MSRIIQWIIGKIKASEGDKQNLATEQCTHTTEICGL
jgi:hypothetical protein